MGQPRNVLVYRLLCEDTIDERITAMLEEKQAIFDAFADKSVAARESFELDEKTFGNIINEEIERIKEKYSKSGKTPKWQEKKAGNSTEEYKNQMNLSYQELVDYLIKKYGAAKEDYFINDSFASKNNPIDSMIDALGMGLGFTVSIIIIAAIRQGLSKFMPVFATTVGGFLILGFRVFRLSST